MPQGDTQLDLFQQSGGIMQDANMGKVCVTAGALSDEVFTTITNGPEHDDPRGNHAEDHQFVKHPGA